MSRKELISHSKTTHTAAAVNPQYTGKGDLVLLNEYRGALMGIAALWIYFFHEWIPVFDKYPVLSAAELFLKKIGFCGVDIFLFLSGAGITYSITRSKNLLSFYCRRLQRVLFPFIAMALIRAFFEHWSVGEFWKNITGIHFFTRNIYSFLWFVPMILTFYLFTPLYYYLFKKSGSKVAFTFCALILWLLLSQYLKDSMRTDLFGFTNRIPIYITGILTGWLLQHKDILFGRIAWMGLVLMLILGLLSAYLTGYAGLYLLVPLSDCCLPNILIALSLSLLLSGFFRFLKKSRYSKVPENCLVKFFSFYGTFTLEFYCLQEWMGEHILWRLAGKYGAMVQNLILLILVTLASLLMHYGARLFWHLLSRLLTKCKGGASKGTAP